MPSVPNQREESHKREGEREGEKDERNKKLRKADSKENIPVSAEKKLVSWWVGVSLLYLLCRLPDRIVLFLQIKSTSKS